MNTQKENGSIKLRVDELLRLCKSGDATQLSCYVSECPQAPSKDIVLKTISECGSAELRFLALNMLGEQYSRGIDPELGSDLSEAIYLCARELYSRSRSASHLANAARAAVNHVIGLNAVGRHEELASFADTAGRWLEESGHMEAKADLFLYRIEALINLPRYEEAEALLNQADSEGILSSHPNHRIRKERLAEIVKLALRPATELPSKQLPMRDKEVMIEARRTMLGDFAAATEIMPPELRAMAHDFVRKSLAKEELEKDLPDSIVEWALKNQKRMDHLTDFLSGKAAEDVIRDYSQSIGRPDLAQKLLDSLKNEQ